ncbi:MAG: response regulator [Paraburkholderia tropica]|uniref:response regulator n=1 Tax=Paraburkholderia tropica TaxID=92647 RepID=UPI0013747479|nr:response regulator [Paraburkholderia tropica]
MVDDLAAARQAIVALLALEGFDVRAAASGPEAVDLVREWPPHVVVLDVTMPEHDGFAVAAVLRGLRSTAEAVIVATTGYDIDELKAKGPIENFDALFLKGEDGALLTTLIRAAIVQKGEAA